MEPENVLLNYLPHRVVVKESSNTTKLRIVYDGSSHAKGVPSVNDALFPGPSTLQPIPGIIMRARTHKYLVIADVEKHSTKFALIRFIEIPFLLQGTITYFLEKNPDPLNRLILENLYVDNSLMYTNDKNQIPYLISESKKRFQDMHMNLREYITNVGEEMDKISEKDKAKDHKIKMLGYDWDSIGDTFIIKIVRPDEDHPTKREVASKMAATFDPLGLVTPIIVHFKLLIQQIWESKVTWKTKIPGKLLTAWKKIKEMYRDDKITVPRQLTNDYDYESVNILVFSDASKDIYATTIYLQYQYKDKPPVIQLLTSKNKIKPANCNTLTIPKMELLAINIGANLAYSTSEQLRLDVAEVIFFTDSSCASYWILSNKTTRQWVSNRVETIYQVKEKFATDGITSSFRHCPTKDNPADIATRGMSTNELQNCSFWFNGPEFLKEPPENWPRKVERSPESVKEFKEIVHSEIIDPKTKKPKKSMLPKLEKTTESESLTILLMDLNTKGKSITTPDGKNVIQQHYGELEAEGISFPANLNIYTDKDGLKRIRKRVKSSVLPAEAHEPIVIHNKHVLAELIMRETHEINGHLPELYTQKAASLKYWILCAGTVAAKVIRSCVVCQKVNAKPFKYPHAKILPGCRTEPSTPFQHVGLDYLGPIAYKNKDTHFKAYVLIYTCLVTRAAKLELIPDGTTARFIESLGIIFNRVGVPETIYSDNAQTFLLGEKILSEDVNSDITSETLTSFLATKDIEFRHITPLAPWQGGIYERLVGLVKAQIIKAIGKNILDFHSLRYVLSGAEAMINSRPLTPNPNSPDDMIAIRPQDFLNPGVLLEVPKNSIRFDPTRSNTEQRTRDHLNKLEGVLNELWKLWSLRYLSTLRELKHKNKKCSTLLPKIGQVVLIVTDLLIPLEVEEHHLDHDNDLHPPTPSIEEEDDPDDKSSPLPLPPSPAHIQQLPSNLAPKLSQTKAQEAKNSNDTNIQNLSRDINVPRDTNKHQTEVEDCYAEYKDPVVPEPMDFGKIQLPERRTREYLSRKAKLAEKNYVHYLSNECSHRSHDVVVNQFRCFTGTHGERERGTGDVIDTDYYHPTRPPHQF
nr:hypothetical protein Y48C3A.a - Caenorhabditis elegans [Caenorhabditis elegans]